MPRQLTIRNVSDETGRRLEGLSRARHQSLNTTVLQILEAAVQLDSRRQRLARYATWTEQDRRDFEQALAAQRTLDDPSWQ